MEPFTFFAGIVILAVVVLAFVFSAGVLYGAGLKETQLKPTILNKENVVACFKDVNWAQYTFVVNNHNNGSYDIKTADGETHFYKAAPIDAAIKKLNELLNSQPSQALKDEKE